MTRLPPAAGSARGGQRGRKSSSRNHRSEPWQSSSAYSTTQHGSNALPNVPHGKLSSRRQISRLNSSQRRRRQRRCLHRQQHPLPPRRTLHRPRLSSRSPSSRQQISRLNSAT